MGGVMLALLSAITVNIDPVLVKIGPFTLRWYGLMYVAGIVVGLLIVLPYARRRDVSSEQVWNIFWAVAIASLVGGRLYYVVQNNPGDYLKHPGDILAFWQGGMAFFGAIILGVPVLLIMAYFQKVPFGVALDCIAIFAPLAQAVGRIGNILNGDIVGDPSNLPWAVKYTNPNSFVPSDLLGVAVQPAAVYELLFSLGLFLVLWPLRYKLRPAGLLFVLYLSLYCVGQFILFAWRHEDIAALGLKQAQITAVVIQALLVAVAYLILLRPWVFDPQFAGDYDDEDEYEDDADDAGDESDGATPAAEAEVASVGAGSSAGVSGEAGEPTA
jgi:phosphatidylglycerol:prolipoprotein diacylglycerol transferase